MDYKFNFMNHCFAPVFRKSGAWGCLFILIIYIIAVLPILVFAALFSKKARCTLKQTKYKLRNCRRGNNDGTIKL